MKGFLQALLELALVVSLALFIGGLLAIGYVRWFAR